MTTARATETETETTARAEAEPQTEPRFRRATEGIGTPTRAPLVSLRLISLERGRPTAGAPRPAPEPPDERPPIPHHLGGGAPSGAERAVKRSCATGVAVISLLAIALVGCADNTNRTEASSPAASPTDDGGAAPTGTVVVLAAASLTDAFGDLAAAFEQAHPAVDVQLGFAGSSALREQVLEGAPADVFASADPANVEPLVAAGEVTGTPTTFATNTMVIAVPDGNPAAVTSLADLADDDRFIGLCAEVVPCGDLARQVLANAGVVARPDTAEPDVRALLTKIAAGELDAGIVYRTDATAADVEAVAIPDDVNVIARYPIASVTASPNPTAGAAFVEFVLSPTGQDILAGHGFGPP